MSEMERMVDRVVDHDPASDIAGMTMMLYGLPRPDVENFDALAVQPGLGEWWRVRETVRDWNTSETPRHLLVTGVDDTEETYVEHSVEVLAKPPFNLTRFDGVETQVQAANTVEQSDWLVGQVEAHGITSMRLGVSPYHMLRAFCTTLRAFDRNGVPWIPMIPVPTAVPPDVRIPETVISDKLSDSNAWDMVSSEYGRMLKYQPKGDVATRGQLDDYLTWLWEQPLLTPLRADISEPVPPTVPEDQGV